ncbi:hypothetical protein Glove_218g36 [Diversispora epigaea]|uniref:Uncharacterized protein n=1 Tax=Diversispora epigaea TaxID=1348612 RepID=A0A397IJE7_9GLOM|nr:hypothetical protein Glove_218g36 [Diversispora epigaea]
MAFPNLGVWFIQVMTSMSRKLCLLSSFHKLLSTLHISGHTNYHNINISRICNKSIFTSAIAGLPAFTIPSTSRHIRFGTELTAPFVVEEEKETLVE